MIIKAVAFSDRGMSLGQRLNTVFGDIFTLERCPHGGLAAWAASAWDDSDALVFIGSCGIAVRAIAPHVRKKTTDPAVIVIDELGMHAVSLLSGHLGGANELTLKLAEAVGAEPVITTATDINGLFAADDWARSQGMAVADPGMIKHVSSKLLSGGTVRVKSEFAVKGQIPLHLEYSDDDHDILISCRTDGRQGVLRLVPRAVTLGVGCHRNIELEALEKAFSEILEKSGVFPQAVFQAATIDLKKDEPALLEFCEKHDLPLRIFTADELMSVPGEFSGSEFVKKITGVDNVCERAAVLASGGHLINKKEAGNGVTMALAVREPDLCWP